MSSEAPEFKRPDLRIVRNSGDAPALPLSKDDTGLDEVHGAELEPKVYNGQIIDDMPQRATVPAVRLPVTIAGRVVVHPSERTIKVAKVTASVAVTTGQGWHSWLVRAWDALTLGVYRRQIRAAEAAGDHVRLAEWIDRKHVAAAHRHDRLMVLPRKALGLATVTVGCLAGSGVAIAGVSTLAWAVGAADWLTIPQAVGTGIRWVFEAAGFMSKPLLVGAPAALIWAAWREGRRRGDTPAWLVTEQSEAPDGRDIIPDEGAILNALRHLGVSELNKAFKAGWKPRIPLPTQRDGKGYRTQVVLPPGVPVETIVKHKATLAHNLVRFPREVWPTEPRDNPGVLDLWVADQGSLSGPVPPWPLLDEGAADYFKGVPVAVNIRGKSINGRLFEANYAVAGMMGSGKSTLIIDLLLGALLDPLVDADVYVMADNADYDPMKPRLRTLMTGTGGDVVEACMETMNELYADLTTRGQALKEHGVRAASRRLAEIDARLRPRILVIDECQALYLDDKYGEKAVDVSVKLQNAARKYAITIIRATPEASSDSLPRRLTAVTSNKACFAIGDQTSNDAVLGTGSYKAGISAVGLEPKTDESLGDVGTFMGKGFEPRPGLLRSYYVSQAEAHQVVARAMEIRRKAGIGPGQPAPQVRDLVDDLVEVLGGTPDGERVRLADIPGMLRRLAPAWLPYESLTGTELRDVLTREHAVKVTNSGNVLRLDPAEVRRVKASREAGE